MNCNLRFVFEFPAFRVLAERLLLVNQLIYLVSAG